MTIDEAISHAEEVAEQEECFINYPHSDIVRDDLNIESRKHYVAEQRQLAEWLTELKDLREENKVLTSECDRLIKEKGELLSKVSGSDVLRICQLEEQLQVELDNSHCLEIELKEAKRLLKATTSDIYEVCSCNTLGCGICEHKRETCDYDDRFTWRHKDAVLNLLKKG